jgi:hypothetical protein
LSSRRNVLEEANIWIFAITWQYCPILATPSFGIVKFSSNVNGA